MAVTKSGRIGENGTRSLATSLALADGHPSGFDYMRISLALAITCCHACITSYGPQADLVFYDTPAKPLYRIMLPMFFALSGFLVASSLGRCRSLISFLGLRAIRIYPALIMETLLSAMVIGPLLSTWSPAAYFGDPLFRSYLLNMLGDVHYALPGVFAQAPLPEIVNGQLWTVPYELGCYIALSILVAMGINRWRVLAPIATVLVLVAFVTTKTIKHGGAMPSFVTALSGPLLIISFLGGVSLYLYRDEVPHDRRLLAFTLLASIALLGVVPYGEYVAPLPIAYVTVYLGLLDPPRRGLIKGADYSYGLYLYSFPIQQALAAEFVWARAWYINILICVPLSLMVAAASWILVERPALRLRGSVKRLEAWVLGLRWDGRREIVAG